MLNLPGLNCLERGLAKIVRIVPYAVALLIVFAGCIPECRAQDRHLSSIIALISTYPEFLDRVDDNDLVWKDGSRMLIDDKKGSKTLEDVLNSPDLKDMFLMVYPAGEKGIPPAHDFDPGRVRYMPLFDKMYGDCKKGEVASNLTNVIWLPRKSGKIIRFSKVNGAAAALQNASDELDHLPTKFDVFLTPIQGTYNCRPIAGTNLSSAHGLGIAIDISAANSHYWRWQKPDSDGRIVYHNEIPWEIVKIFEKYGFIWGGKWYHFDTMHFEYRPEIMKIAK